MPFETFVHACTLTLPLPSPPPPKNVRLGLLVNLQKNTLPPPPPPAKNWILCQKIHLPLPPPPPHSPRPHTPPPHPAQFFLIWIICLSVSVFFYKLTKNPNLKRSSFFSFLFFSFFFAGVGWGVNIMYRCLKWHFYSSKNTNVPSYSEIHA